MRYELLVGEQSDQENDHSDQRRAGGDGDRLVDAAYRMSAAVGPQDRVNGQLGRDGDGDDGQERPRLDVVDGEVGPQGRRDRQGERPAERVPRDQQCPARQPAHRVLRVAPALRRTGAHKTRH